MGAEALTSHKMLFQCPKLTPLQSRFVASFAALVMLGIIYWSLSSPHFAYAGELVVDGNGEVREGQDHNWHRIEEQRLKDDGIVDDDGEGDTALYERAVSEMTISGNNAPNLLNIMAGNTTVWLYPKELLLQNFTETGPGLPSQIGVKRDFDKGLHSELRKRQDGSETRTIYVSINTCLQPTWNGTGTQTAAPPQLTLYVATQSDNSNVGPTGSNQIVQPLQEGFANVSLQATGNWYIAVHAPALPDNFSGVWNYELAVSIDAFYHAADMDDPFLFLVDTDINSALLVTNNLTQESPSSTVFKKWMSLTDPFIMFAANKNHTSTMGIMSSYCGWSNAKQIAASQSDPSGSSSPIQMGMITRGLGNKPKEQFYVTNLNGSSTYTGVLAMDGNSTNSGAGVVGGGGKVWKSVNWTTKTAGNCALLFNLTFCSEVAYAVPSNPNSNYSAISALRTFYDSGAYAYYQTFNYSLQQIPCNTTSDAQYSLARNCTDCAAAYKEWLCAVTIPRCEDFTNPDPWLQMRNVGQQFYNNNSMLPDEFLNTPYSPMLRAPTVDGSLAFRQTYSTSMATNQSRNPAIDQSIQPGPYKEVKPCEDLCYNLVQSCPAALSFGCPWPGRGLEASYGQRSTNGTITCSYLGAVYNLNAGDKVFAPLFSAVALAALTGLIIGVV